MNPRRYQLNPVIKINVASGLSRILRCLLSPTVFSTFGMYALHNHSVNIMDFNPVFRIYYVTQLTLRKGDNRFGPDLII